MPHFKRIAATCLGLTLVSSAAASEYCTKEQYERDRALIEMATSSGWLVKGSQALADSILVDEAEWYKMNYPQQIAFMQSFECAMAGASGKKFLYMNVKSLATGTLLATWRLGALEPTGERPPTNPEMSGGTRNKNRTGLTGERRAAFIKATTEECNKRSANINCGCYANAVADYISIIELEQASGFKNRQAAMTAMQPKLEAAAKGCLKN